MENGFRGLAVRKGQEKSAAEAAQRDANQRRNQFIPLNAAAILFTLN